MAGIDLIHVPYKGGAPAVTDVIAGQIQMAFGSTFTMIPQVSTGRLRALAVTAAQRSSVLPQVPTIAESALPGFESTTWYGVFTAAATPRNVIAKLHADMARAIRTSEVTDRLTRDGSDPVASEPAAFDTYVRAEIEKARRIVKTSGMKMD